jgi:ubiquinone/menaquinone biosynthesis C-methylase UbiE
MTIAAILQPDQRPARWDDHVALYEQVFEPLTVEFAHAAIRRLQVRPGERVLDIASGAGGAALALAEAGVAVTAIDGSVGMIDRVRARAAAHGVAVDARVMDGMRLEFPDHAFDAALSVLGVVLFPDAAKGLREMRRVVHPGGRLAVVTWTQPHRYELAAHLREAILSLGPEPVAPQEPPAQLRYVDAADFERLFAEAEMDRVAIEVVEARLRVPSARWLADRIDFAPGMEAWISGLGEQRSAALDAFVSRLERSHGFGPLSLGAVASLGIAPVK